jgi:ferredoxin
MVVKLKKDECIACGACVDACPVEAITLEETAVIDAEKCTDCGTCVEECPVDALEL